MKKLMIMIAILIGFSASAQAKIEIKGWSTGGKWTYDEPDGGYMLRKDSPFDYTDLQMTIAKQDVEYLYIKADVNVERIAYLQFTLDSDAFDGVKNAVNSKYPLTCDTHKVQNNAGATFLNEVCFHKHDGDILEIEKYAGKISEMSLILFNEADVNEIGKQADQETNSDI